MKKNLITLVLVFLSFLLFLNLATAQMDVQSGCTSITVTVDYPLLRDGADTDVDPAPCTNIKTGIFQLSAEISLQRLENGTWTTIEEVGPVGSGVEHTFFNLSKGEYRVEGIIPQPRMCNNVTPSTPWLIMDTSLRLIGPEGDMGLPSYSETVVVGQAEVSDIDFHFIDGNAIPNAWDHNGEEPLVDFSGTQNYTSYFLAIFKITGTGGYYASTPGWQEGNLDIVNLNQIWSDHHGITDNRLGNGEALSTYHIQFAINNSNCPGPWTAVEPTFDDEGNIVDFNGTAFAICADDAACRFGNFEDIVDSKPRIFPNPANSSFQIELSQYDSTEEYSIEIFSMTGKRVKSERVLNNNHIVDVTDFADGLYAYSILKNNQKVLTDKLMVNH